MSYNPPPPPPFDPSQPYGGPMPAGPPPGKGRSHKGLIAAMIFAVVAVMLLCCVLVFAPNDDDEGVNGQARIDTTEPAVPLAEPVDPQPEPSAEEPSPSPVASPKPKVVVLEAGTYEVGKRTDAEAGVIAPGTYKIHTPEGGINCYWARLKNFDGELTSIRSNGNVADGKTARVTVKASDAGLELLGSCEARR